MERNRILSKIFGEMASLTRFLEGSQSFRASAYDHAAEALGRMDEDIASYIEEGTATELEGIGKSIAAKIEEYLNAGSIQKLKELRAKVPEDLIPLMEVKGLGPKTLRKFHGELGIVDREGLEKALGDGSVEKLEGFGAKKVEKIRQGLEMHDEGKERILLPRAIEIGNKVLEEMREVSGILQMELAGSLRRKRSTIGDIDLLVAAEEKDMPEIHEAFVNLENTRSVISHGSTRSSIRLEESDRQVDLRTVQPEQWGAALHYFTGSQAHNVRMRSMANQKGWKVSEYGLFDENGKTLAGESEAGLYSVFDMDWIPPELREDRGEIEAAMGNELPRSIELADLKGDLHMHSSYSDGRHTLEAIAQHLLEERGDSYMAITDHSKAVGVAGGMDDGGFLEQLEAIKTLKDRYGKNRILAGAEVDILSDGSLDLKDETLAEMDWVLASIHSGMDRDNTERLIRACENPYVNAIGHPTGGLIGQRKPYPLEEERVFEAAKTSGTALEINAQPRRVDLDDERAFKARQKGIWLVINTDMHRFQHLDHRSSGIAVARRAWCSPGDVLNAQPIERILQMVRQKRERSLSKA